MSLTTNPNLEYDTGKGKSKEVPLPQLSSLESSPYVSSYPQTPHAQGVVDLSYDLLKPTSRMPAGLPRAGASVSRPPSASPTPSLRSLIPAQPETVESLLLGSEPENLFRETAAMFNILIEPIADSVERWHAIPDVHASEDPLKEVGGEAGIIPDQSERTAALMRAVLLRWRSPHRFLIWNDLSADLPQFLTKEFTLDADTMIAVQSNDSKVVPRFCLRVAILERMGHVILAVQQILVALSELRSIPASRAFSIDPQYTFVRSLEYSLDKARLELTWEMLLHRLSRAHDNIEAQIRSLRRYFTDSDARLSQSPRTELAKYWYPEKLRQSLPSHLRSPAEELVVNLKADGYRVPSYRERSPPPLSSASSRRPSQKQIQFAPVTAVIPAHPISRLPGLPSPTFKSGGPLSRPPSGERESWREPPAHLTSSTRPGAGQPYIASPREREPDHQLPRREDNLFQRRERRPGGPPSGSSDSSDDDRRRRIPPWQPPPGPPGGPPDRGDPENGGGRRRRPRRASPPRDPDDPDGPGRGPRPDSSPLRAAERWQVNHKIPLSSLPEWNGDGRTLIDYLTDLATFSDLGELMEADIAQIASSRFTDAAKDWFTTLPSEVRRIATSSYLQFVLCIREHFMDAHWIDERTIEYEEMRFRQEGHKRETPLQFVQRRLKYTRFLNSENDDNDVGMVQRVLRTQPACWAIHLNVETCRSVVELIRKLKSMNDGLIADWERSESRRQPRSQRYDSSTPSRRYYSRRISAHNVEGEDLSDESRSPSPTQEAFAVDFRRNEETRNKWPRGGSWDNYSFTRDDSRTSEQPPKDVCWICTSPKHVHRDCPHFAKWLGMRDAWLGRGKNERRSDIRTRVAKTVEVGNDDNIPRSTRACSKE
ncbi:hypothetical protein PTI98_010933 [Pleurotus ostreatus]|nr:hypothetical protein PTI98_010933 [Pleurotus ostreatus]